jgi:hypothetical protein
MKLILLLIPGLLLLAGCQKEVTQDMIDDFSNDSTYIRKVISLDSTKPAGLDTGFTAEYFYDAQKRLIRETETEYGPGVLRYIYTDQYLYQGADTLPNRILYTDNQTSDSTYVFLTYNNGFIVKDSSVIHTGGQATPLELRYFSPNGSNGYLLRIYHFDYITGLPVLSDSITYTRQIVDGNCITGSDKHWDANTGSLRGTVSYQNTFDDKKNPFLKIHLWPLGYYENDILQLNYFGKNNVTAFSQTPNPAGFPGSPGQRNMTFQHSYGTDNYPVVTRVMTGVLDFNKLLYQYIKM